MGTETTINPATMGTETTMQNKQETPNKGNEYAVTNRKILRVMKGENKRYFFEVDGEPFASYNKDHEETTSNAFSLDIYEIARQVASKHEIFNTAFAMAGVVKNAQLNPAIVSLAFTNATISFKRVHKNSDDLRETGKEDDTYGHNIWKTYITDITPNISAFAQQALVQLIFNPNTLVVKEEANTPSLKALLEQAQ